MPPKSPKKDQDNTQGTNASSTTTAGGEEKGRSSAGQSLLERQDTSAARGTLLRGVSFLADEPVIPKKKVSPTKKGAASAGGTEGTKLAEELGKGKTGTTGVSPVMMAREPTMLKDPKKLIPSPVPENFENKKPYTFVLDLDETVVYARDGPLFARAHLKDLLRVMNEAGEVIVWTAGDREYAKAVLQEINMEDIIKHLVYRDKTWFDAKDYTKDLKQLGRNLDWVIIIENTPDCLRKNPENGIIVDDYEGGKNRDSTLLNLIRLIKDLSESQKKVPDFLKQCKLLQKQVVNTGGTNDIPIYFLPSRKIPERKSGGGVAAATNESGGEEPVQSPSQQKVVKRNRDRQYEDESQLPPSAVMGSTTTPLTTSPKKVPASPKSPTTGKKSNLATAPETKQLSGTKRSPSKSEAASTTAEAPETPSQKKRKTEGPKVL